MKNTDEHIAALIGKQLRKEASREEQAELQAWLDADAANRSAYADMEGIWEASLPVLQHHSFDTAAAWEKVRPRVPDHARFSGRQRWMAAAAALVLVAGAGWWFYRTGSGVATKSVIAFDGNRRVDLPDGSVAFLRKGGTISYPERFSGHQRRVELTGEAYFEAGHDAANPFIVQTARALVEELGTSFVIKEEPLGMEVTVTAGTVKCTARAAAARNIILATGEKAILTDSGLSKSASSDANILSWKTGVLEFKGTPLDQVVADVQDLYGIPVALSPDLRAESGNIRVTARFSHTERANDVLEEIKLMSGLAIRQEKDTLVFFRK